MKRLILLFVCTLLVYTSGCSQPASVAGPLPDYTDKPIFVSSHRRAPQSVHGRTGVVSDVRWQKTRQKSEQLHIGDWNSRDNSGLPPYKLFFCPAEQVLTIRIFAVHSTPLIWQEKFDEYIRQSLLIEAITWQQAEDELYLELVLTFTQPVLYRSWYYTNTCYFTVEISAAPQEHE
jgi:hypothetical protein